MLEEFGNHCHKCLFRDLTGPEVEPLQKRIMCLSHEVVRFPVFKLGVLATFIYQGKTKNVMCSFDFLSYNYYKPFYGCVSRDWSCAISMSCLNTNTREDVVAS